MERAANTCTNRRRSVGSQEGSANASLLHSSLLRLGLRLLVLFTAIALITGCGDTAAQSSTSGARVPTSPSTATPLAEHLKFSGDVSGVLTTGIDPHPITHDNPLPAYVEQNGVFTAPAPTWTQCSDFDVSGAGRDYVAVIIGMVGTKRYAVTAEINEDDPAYTKPGTPLRPGTTNSGGGINVYEVGGQGRQWQQVLGPAGQEPAMIVLHPDRASGTVDAWLATTDQSQKIATGTLHLQGNWRCE